MANMNPVRFYYLFAIDIACMDAQEEKLSKASLRVIFAS
jgi:hypothetical protein